MLKVAKNSNINFAKFDEKNPYFHIINALKGAGRLAGMKILDIGCGREPRYQILCRELARLGCVVTGVDTECKNEKGNPQFVRSSIDDFKTKERFDAAISAYFFGYVTNDWARDGLGKKPADYETALLKKLHGMLSAGGLSVHYMNEPWSLSRSDLEKTGFRIIKFPNPVDIFKVEDGLCVLKKWD